MIGTLVWGSSSIDGMRRLLSIVIVWYKSGPSLRAKFRAYLREKKSHTPLFEAPSDQHELRYKLWLQMSTDFEDATFQLSGQNRW
jgi:hypothetical protein